MQAISFLSLILIFASLISQFNLKNTGKTNSKPEVAGQTSDNSQKDLSAKSEVNINEDAGQYIPNPSTWNQFIYPGASQTSIDGNRQIFETSTDADTVYLWYKDELKNSGYQIRTDVKTRSNAVFKAVLVGIKDSNSIRSTVEQYDIDSPTKIILE